jgi:AcrR family transcriptional regulator
MRVDRIAKPMPDATNETVQRIIAAAYACFERYGIAKTSLEDIASQANISRATIYKYFGGKEDIVEYITIEQSKKINAEVRSKITRDGSFAKNLTHILLLIVQAASKNVYVRRIVEANTVSADAVPPSAVHSMQLQWWGRFLQRAADEGELASDLSLDEVVSWIRLAQTLLLVKMDAAEFSDTELRRFINRFIVRPLLSKGAADRDSSSNSGAQKKKSLHARARPPRKA